MAAASALIEKFPVERRETLPTFENDLRGILHWRIALSHIQLCGIQGRDKADFTAPKCTSSILPAKVSAERERALLHLSPDSAGNREQNI